MKSKWAFDLQCRALFVEEYKYDFLFLQEQKSFLTFFVNTNSEDHVMEVYTTSTFKFSHLDLWL